MSSLFIVLYKLVSISYPDNPAAILSFFYSKLQTLVCTILILDISELNLEGPGLGSIPAHIDKHMTTRIL
jgi:hypothetical protein